MEVILEGRQRGYSRHLLEVNQSLLGLLQSLHRGSLSADGERASGAPTSIRRDVRRETWRESLTLSALRLSQGTFGYISEDSLVSVKVRSLYLQEDFWRKTHT